ncbi:MAG: AraC family transcriptional regulator [Bacteroidales bacterium]|nr:AraC family transcriptional regulator [Bacteroidales bacterium]
MKVILLIGAYHTLVLIGMVLTKKQKVLSDYFLSALFAIYGITLFLGYMEAYNLEHNFKYHFFINTSPPFIFLHGPALWFYIKSLTAKNFRFKPKYTLHFLPFLLIFLVMVFNVYTKPVEEKILAVTEEAFKNDFAFPFIIGMIAISTQGYFIWGILLIRKYDRRIKDYFSEVSDIDLKWLKFLLVASIFFYAVNSSMYAIDYFFNVLPYDVLLTTVYSFAAVFVAILGYRGYRQANIFLTREIPEELDKEPATISYEEKTDSSEKEFIDSLLRFMNDKKPHLQPELTISTLAKEINTHVDYLSGILNNRLNKNFFDFINFYRIEEFKRLCKNQNDKNITIMGLAWESGFNSKATFNRVFKKTTGKTPGEFLSATKPVNSDK